MAKLERRTPPRRQQSEKLTQPRYILLEVRRQLKEHRAQTILQRRSDAKEIRHQRACILETPKMRDLLRRLERELEIPGHRTSPGFEDGRRGQTLEGAVDLHGPKTLAVKAEHLVVGKVL